uniref:Peptidase C1A propeptide domain-containing protein n=1 Tax=Triticum urartu TaxID=4572 RepID=A0A8R7U5G0_TRIUA
MGGVGVSLALLVAVVLSAVAAAPQLAGTAKAEHSLGIIQKDIIQTVNKHPNAGWTAGHNPYFANYTIEQFKHILGVKPTPPGLLAGVPIKIHPEMDLPKEFDARTQWSSCSTIGNILGRVTVVPVGPLLPWKLSRIVSVFIST